MQGGEAKPDTCPSIQDSPAAQRGSTAWIPRSMTWWVHRCPSQYRYSCCLLGFGEPSPLVRPVAPRIAPVPTTPATMISPEPILPARLLARSDNGLSMCASSGRSGSNSTSTRSPTAGTKLPPKSVRAVKGDRRAPQTAPRGTGRDHHLGRACTHSPRRPPRSGDRTGEGVRPCGPSAEHA
jgi:hypothetical protein